MKKQTGYISALCVFVLLASCSTKENTMSSRFYHAFTSRYNIYFNGKTSFDESMKSLQDGHKDNYTEQLLMYPVSGLSKEKQTTGGSFDRAIEKSNKAIKLHSIQTKPLKKPGWRNDPKQKALQEMEEYNPFLKKCWLLLGESQFYNADFLQASATFSYIARHYAQDEEMVAEAKLWQARSYAELGWMYESEDILNKLNINGIPKSKQRRYASVYADYLIKSKQSKEAIPYLITAIKAEKNRKQRTRMKYLLGQLYAGEGLDGLAYKAFGQVISANPPYEMEFAARIRQTEVFPGGNATKVIRRLQSMARSEKNVDYLDQVYYAIGNVYMSQQDTIRAIESYESAIEKSKRNGLDKAICQLRLGDIYFKQRAYEKAQPCFLGALAALDKKHRDYERVAKQSVILDELVIHTEAVHLQDSLQTLAKMSEPERLAVIGKIIDKVKKDEEEQKRAAEQAAFLAEQDAKGSGINRTGTGTRTVTMPVATGENSFYFYNPQTVADGKRQFQTRWGRRLLEDNWRRLKKAMNTFVDNQDSNVLSDNAQGTAPDRGNQVVSVDSLPSPVASQDPKDPAFYLQQIPLTEEDLLASDLIIADGLFNMGKIYKDKLEDLPLAIETFETLDRRFPQNKYRLDSYYQLYLMGLRLEDRSLAAQYKSKLMQTFPESDYALAVADPDYAYNIRMMDRVQDSIYEKTYNQYLAGDTTNVRENYRKVTTAYPLSKLLPKFTFLEALTYVQSGDANRFKEALKALVEKYPQADVTELAGEMLKGVMRGRSMVQGDVTGMKWNMRFGLQDGIEPGAIDSTRTFTAGINEPYRMLLIYPAGKVELNQLLFTVASYNFANFMIKEFDLSSESFGEMNMLFIRGFIGMEEILQYYRMIHSESGYAANIEKAVGILPISESNYEVLIHGKTLDEYITFFNENFGESASEIVSRWRIRLMDQADETTEIPAPSFVSDVTDQQADSTNTQSAVPDSIQLIQRPIDSLQLDRTEKAIVIPTDSTLVNEIIQDTLPESEFSADSIPGSVVPESKELTLKEIQAIRAKEAAEEEARKKQQREEFEAKQKADKELQEQKAKERADILKKQEIENQALLKAKADREKALEKEQKDRLKQAEAARKQKIKERKLLLKEKERAYKEQLKKREAERKQKEKLYQQKLRDREKARREALKQK